VAPTQDTLSSYIKDITSLGNAHDLIKHQDGLGVGVQITGDADGNLCLTAGNANTYNGLSMQPCEVIPNCNSLQLWQYYADNVANQQICLWHSSSGEDGREFWQDYCVDPQLGTNLCPKGSDAIFNPLCVNNWGGGFSTVGIWSTPNWTDDNDNLYLNSGNTITAADPNGTTYYLTRSNNEPNATMTLESNNNSPSTQTWFVLDQLSQMPYDLRGWACN
jgi:hypothetical protein